MFIGNLLGFPMLTQDGDGTGGAGVQPLRAAAVQNRVNSASGTIGNFRMIGRWPFIIGSGDFSELVFNNQANFFDNQAQGGPQAGVQPFTIIKMALEKDGGITVPITFGGSRSRVMNTTDSDINTDPVYASAFSQSAFTRGDKYWIRIEVEGPSASWKLPVSVRRVVDAAGTSSAIFNPASTTITNGVDGTGTITATGTALLAQTTGYLPIVLGRFVSGDPKTFLGVGDSIQEGVGDTVTALINGYGNFQLAMTDTDGISNPWASINLSKNAATAANFNQASGTWLKSYFKYCRVMVEENGTNDIGNTGSGSTTTLQSNLQTIWNDFKAVNPTWQIVRTYLLAFTNSTDSWATLANQTPKAAGWAAGGKSQTMNAYFSAQLSAAAVTAITPTSAVVDATDPYSWASNGTANYLTADGLHPSHAGHLIRASEIRTAITPLS